MASDVDIIWEYDKITTYWNLYINKNDLKYNNWLAYVDSAYWATVDPDMLGYSLGLDWIHIQYPTHKEAVADLEDLVHSHLSH